jgi:hypothetical protein
LRQKAAPWLYAPAFTIAILPNICKNLGFDALKEFVPKQTGFTAED